MVTLKNMYPFAPLEGPAVSVLHHPVCEKRIKLQRPILSHTRQKFFDFVESTLAQEISSFNTLCSGHQGNFSWLVSVLCPHSV